MIQEGETAPGFTLPGVRDGEIEQVDGGDFLGEDIVVLAFYPGDFNPACSDEETGLDELDLFTMQKDVTVLALSTDSVYSHRTFADEYGLHMPLLSDTDGSVAADYGVATDDETAGYLPQRAVVVVDHTGVVRHTWRGERPGSVPNAERIRQAITEIGDEDTAQSRYRVGHARYMEGRRAFTSAMKAFERDEWMIAQTDFTQATDEFDRAGEEFNTAVRFAEHEESRMFFERAERKAESLWRAADWLSQSASAFSSGQGGKGQSLRRDAESPLETARDLHEPPDPDEFPPENDPAEEIAVGDSSEPFVPGDDDEPTASLDADLDAVIDDEVDLSEPDEQASGTAADRPEAGARPDEIEDVPAYGNAANTRSRSVATAGSKPRAYPGNELEPASDDPAEETDDSDEADESEIDDAELEAITAELEEQSGTTTELSETEPPGDTVADDDPAGTAAGGVDADPADENVGADPVAASADVDSGDMDAATDSAEDDGNTDAEGEGSDDELESVVDDVTSGVVDVSTDVIAQVGGEVVDTGSDEVPTDDTEGDEQSADDTGDNREVELDLTDPNGGTVGDEETIEDDGTAADDETEVSTGNHGVPDSL